MKRMILVFFVLMFAAICNAQSLQFTYPYILTYPPITCAPASCNAYGQIGYGGFGGVNVLAVGTCVSGLRPYVNPQQIAYACSYPATLIYAYAFASPSPNIYRLSFATINAQQIQGNNGTYGLVGGNWVNIYDGVQFSDCYTGALRSFEPPPHPC